MEQLARETATNTAHVSRILKDLGYELVTGPRERNRFRDGVRVHQPAARFGPIPVTITSRRRTYDVQAEVAKITAALPLSGLEAHHVTVTDDNKFANFDVVRTFVKGKSRDGKTVTKLDGRLWSIQVTMGNVWIVQVNDDTVDLRTVDIDKDPIRRWPFTVAATLKRRNSGQGRNLIWCTTMGNRNLPEYSSLKVARQAVLDALKENNKEE